MTECQGRFFILKRAGRLSKSGHSLPLQPSQPHRIVPSACCAPVVLCARTKWRMTLLFANAKNAFAVALNATVSPQSGALLHGARSEEHTSELQSLLRISYAAFCLTKKTSASHSPSSH